MVGNQKMLLIIIVSVLDSLNLLYLCFLYMMFESRREVFGKARLLVVGILTQYLEHIIKYKVFI